MPAGVFAYGFPHNSSEWTEKTADWHQDIGKIEGDVHRFSLCARLSIDIRFESEFARHLNENMTLTQHMPGNKLLIVPVGCVERQVTKAGYVVVPDDLGLASEAWAQFNNYEEISICDKP